MLAESWLLVLSIQLAAQRQSGLPDALQAIPVVSLERLPTIDLTAHDRDERPLREAAWLGIGPDDRIYAVSEPDHAMHVFDGDGCAVHVIPHGRWSGADLPRISMPYGELVDEESWLQPGFDRRWVGTPGTIRLVASSLETVVEHTAKSLGGASVHLFSVAGDGSACVAVYARSRRAVVILSADGSVRTRWELPEHLIHSGIAHDGKRIALALREDVVVADTTGAVQFRVRIEPALWSFCGTPPDTTWKVHLACSGKELWLREGWCATTIERYVMP